MNPGAFVMGGGGSGGGGSGRGGSGSGSGQGADGQGGGEGAQGGGDGAGACGQGGQGACPNPAHGAGGTSAGDPIDPTSGRVYTMPVVDLRLAGPLPLVVERTYSSDRASEDIGLGWGWSHSFAFRLRPHRRRPKLLIETPYASNLHVRLPEIHQEVATPVGRLLRTPHGYVIQRGALTYVFRDADAWRGAHLLTRVVDPNGNTISLHYENGVLHTIVDSVGRLVRVRRARNGRIEAFETKNIEVQGQWVFQRRYEYDAMGRLERAVDATGRAESYAYDEDNRLLLRSTPAGLSVHFVYDAAGRGIETWCERTPSSLDREVPATLADGTPAKGFLHARVNYYDDGFREVVTSRSVRRLDGNQFDKAGRIVWAGGVHTSEYDGAGRRVSYTDAEQHRWQWVYDERGELVQATNPLGDTTFYETSAVGDNRVTLPDGASAVYATDARSNLRRVSDAHGNEIVSYAYDERGLLTEAVMPNGAITKLEYDIFGNRVNVREPDGDGRKIAYDGLGRVQSFTDATGARRSFGYDAMGRLVTERGPVGERRYSYDADGELVALTDPDGRTTTFERGGFGVVTRIIRPDGSDVRYFYDREQELVRVIDELGAEHTLERDAEGRVIAERTFDDRRIRYRLDLNGRITGVSRDGLETTDIVYDSMGRILSRAHSDGREETFEYDPMGRMLAAKSDDVTCTFEYDASGNLVRERVAVVDGEGFEVHAAYDRALRPTRLEQPDGTVVEMAWTPGRRLASIAVDGAALVRHAYDRAGRRTAEELAGGGRVERAFDPEARVERLAIRRADGKQELEQKLAWSPGGDLKSIDETGRRTEHEVDRNGRVIVRRRTGELEERYAYDAKGSVHVPASGVRSYGPGGRLLEAGSWTYQYDALGRVILKQHRDDPKLRWSYEWSSAGLLERTRGPDIEVRYRYDAFARRHDKRVLRAGRIASLTRYQWNGDALVGLRESRRRDDDGVDTIEWSFVYEPHNPAPVASRCRINGVDQQWSYWVHSESELLPLARIDARGGLLERVEATLLGKVSSETNLPIRFPGQIEDAETGLHYNRHRYYDPETGNYLTPEPLGLQGSLLPYAYVDSFPLHGCDLDGLAVTTTVRTRASTRGNGYNPPPDPHTRQSAGGHGEPTTPELHPAVAAAMPPNNARDGDTLPEACGEPRALSDYLFDYEEQTGLRCDPGTNEGRANLRNALRGIQGIESIETRDDGSEVARSPCPNCSQMISRMYGIAGLDPPRGVGDPPETAGGNRGDQQSATRVSPGERTAGGGGPGVYDPPRRPQVPQADQGRYADAVTAAADGNRGTWGDSHGPARPNAPVPDAGTFSHRDGVWQRD